MARVLIVDDDDGIRDTVRFLLEDAGYGVVEAPNGADGLAMLRTSREPLIVLLDFRMPVMDGGEVLRAVVAERLSGRHAYILLLASPEFIDMYPDVREIVGELGIPTVTKPFDILDLLAVVADRAAQFGAA